MRIHQIIITLLSEVVTNFNLLVFLKNLSMKKVLNKVLLLGSGALKIGEAGEFDYSGTQAIKALKEEGKHIVLVNPNVATIQTSKGLADEIYFLPVTAYFVEKVISKEKPDGILLSFGGQTALNCGIELHKKGILKKHSVKILGTPVEAIMATEDRKIFAERLARIGLPTAKGKTVSSVKEGLTFAKQLGLPVMVRAGFALGGTGSGVATTTQKLEDLLTKAFASTSQVIIEESLYGWKEVEYEVLRDYDDNCITVCNMENFDPVGIHTGESIVVAPSQTLTDREYYSLRQTSIDVIRELKIIGECNIQFALNPRASEFRIIEVNARLSRSSALASKATGYPLAYVAAKLALGKTLPELRNLVTGKTSAYFEPALDYIVVKMPRWDLDKLNKVQGGIGSEMKSVGEVMSIGRSFPEAVQKAARMLNDGYEGVVDKNFSSESKDELLTKLKTSDTMRLFTICSALTKGVPLEEIAALTKIDNWFLNELSKICKLFIDLSKKPLTRTLLSDAKQLGFSDSQLATIYKEKEINIRKKRLQWNITPYIKRIDTMAGEFPAQTNYMYMTYHATKSDHQPEISYSSSELKAGREVTSKKYSSRLRSNNKIAVIGGGPYAIGTSVEFDWCAVNTVATARKMGWTTIMINCNPETVSTDFDYSDYLYFEELTLERVLDIFDVEHAPFIVSVGGQIPNNLAPKLADAKIPILGTSPTQIYRAEHRKTFSEILDRLGIPQPFWTKVETTKEAFREVERIGYPVLVRPSFVLSGKAMSLIYSEAELKEYASFIKLDSRQHSLVMSHFLEGACECDFDAVAQNGEIIISALSEHVEHGGVHSGDATLMLPAAKISPSNTQDMHQAAAKIIKELKVNGPVNIQFLIYQDEPYVIECNLRASRSFPFVSKTYDRNFISIATEIALGKKLKPITLTKTPPQAIKVSQFSFHKLRGADPVLRVEMSSTGEVAAFGQDPYEAYILGLMATGVKYPVKKAAFISLGGMKGKLAFLQSAKDLQRLGYELYATSGTALFLKEHNIQIKLVGKIYEGLHPTALDLFTDKLIDFAVVIPETTQEVVKDLVQKSYSDGYMMRRWAIDLSIPLFTNAESARFFVRAIKMYTPDRLTVKSWNEWVSQK